MPKIFTQNPAQPTDVIAPRKTVFDFMKGHFLYKNRSSSQIKKLIPCFELKKYSAGQAIFKEGDIGDRLLIVAKGLVQLTQKLPSGKPKVLSRLGAGEVLGEYSFVTTKHVLTATVSAYEPTLVLEMRRSVYNEVKGQTFMEPIKHRVEFSRKLLIRQSLKKLPFLATVTDSQLADVDRYFKLEEKPKGTRIFQEGDLGDRFYVLVSGKVVVTTMDDLGFITEVARLEPVASFGEQALITKEKRNATVTTLEDSQFYTLSAKEFQIFLKNTPRAKAELDASIKANKVGNYFADSVPIFKSMSKRHQHLLGVVADLVYFKPNTVIKEEGTNKGLNFYLIVSGNCDIIVGEEYIKTLGAGDYFGEVGIISNAPSSATVKVTDKEDCIVMSVSKDDFNAIFADEPAFLSELKIRLDGANCSLSDLLQHPKGRASFLHHCQQEYAKENVDFWQDVLAIENIKTRRMRKSVLNAMKIPIPAIKERKAQLLEDRARAVFHKYLKPNSEEEVNLPAEVKDRLIKRFDDNDLSYDMFAEARESIYELIEADNFQRYKASEAFEALIKQIGTYKRVSVVNPDDQ